MGERDERKAVLHILVLHDIAILNASSEAAEQSEREETVDRILKLLDTPRGERVEGLTREEMALLYTFLSGRFLTRSPLPESHGMVEVFAKLRAAHTALTILPTEEEACTHPDLPVGHPASYCPDCDTEDVATGASAARNCGRCGAIIEQSYATIAWCIDCLAFVPDVPRPAEPDAGAPETYTIERMSDGVKVEVPFEEPGAESGEDEPDNMLALMLERIVSTSHGVLAGNVVTALEKAARRLRSRLERGGEEGLLKDPGTAAPHSPKEGESPIGGHPLIAKADCGEKSYSTGSQEGEREPDRERFDKCGLDHQLGGHELANLLTAMVALGKEYGFDGEIAVQKMLAPWPRPTPEQPVSPQPTEGEETRPTPEHTPEQVLASLLRRLDEADHYAPEVCHDRGDFDLEWFNKGNTVSASIDEKGQLAWASLFANDSGTHGTTTDGLFEELAKYDKAVEASHRSTTREDREREV